MNLSQPQFSHLQNGNGLLYLPPSQVQGRVGEMECVSGFVNTAVHRGGAQVEPWGSAGGMASVALASGALSS